MTPEERARLRAIAIADAATPEPWDRWSGIDVPALLDEVDRLEQELSARRAVEPMLDVDQLARLQTIADSAVEDIKHYDGPRGTVTWDNRRVGRMLARDPVIAELLPLAIAELIAWRTARDKERIDG